MDHARSYGPGKVGAKGWRKPGRVSGEDDTRRGCQAAKGKVSGVKSVKRDAMVVQGGGEESAKGIGIKGEIYEEVQRRWRR